MSEAEDIVPVDNDGWILLSDYCREYDENPVTVHRRVADGLWERGVIYATATTGQAYVHLPRVLEWRARRDAREKARAAAQ